IIKSIARGPWATADRTHTTWYQPLEAQADIDRAVHWILGLPGIFINTVGDLALLPKMLDAASRYERQPSDDEMTTLVGSTRMTSLFGLPAGGVAMPIYHVCFTCAPDYNARRLPFRPAHLKQLASLREQGKVVAGGPEPDGTAAHIYYRVGDQGALMNLL